MINPALGDSEYGRLISLLDLPTDALTDAACLFLEWKGQRFCIDYGTDNALDKAKAFPDWSTQKFAWKWLGYQNRKRLEVM
jgi:hypothetical protein